MLLTGLVQSHHYIQIEDLIEKVERKKREEYRKKNLNSKINGNTVDEYDGYEIRM